MSRAHNCTLWRAAACMANAVPQAPAPITKIFIATPSYINSNAGAACGRLPGRYNKGLAT
ncbi:hypothetical protein GCM10027195_05050 [Comamonas sediminis]